MVRARRATYLVFFILVASAITQDASADPATAPSARPPATSPATLPVTSQAATAPTPDPDPATLFEKTYGSEARRAALSRIDSVTFARKLLAAVRVAEVQPQFQEMLDEKAIRFAVKDRTGYPVALGALSQLRLLRPERSLERGERTVGLLEKMYAASSSDDKALLAGPYCAVLQRFAVGKARQCPHGLAISLELALSASRKAEEMARQLDRDRAAEAAAVTTQIADRQRLVPH